MEDEPFLFGSTEHGFYNDLDDVITRTNDRRTNASGNSSLHSHYSFRFFAPSPSNDGNKTLQEYHSLLKLSRWNMAASEIYFPIFDMRQKRKGTGIFAGQIALHMIK